jgi:hypothetical protein
MQLDQPVHFAGAVTAPSAVGGDAEVVYEPLRGDNTSLGAGDAVGRMEKPEVELGLRAQRQSGQLLEEADVDPALLDRQVDPVE